MTPKKVVWATSFARDMYTVSGRPLIDSFLAVKPCGTLFVGSEGLSEDEAAKYVTTPGRVTNYRLDDDKFLKEFLAANADVIPTHLGGKAKFPECACKGGPFGPHDKRHKLPCVGYWFCKNFSRWFRKIATMRRAVELHPDTEILVWVDADCRFLKRVDERMLVAKWFQLAHGCFYFRSKRPVIETGIVGYWLPAGGRKVLDALTARYTSGRFRADPRWDDSYQTQEALREVKVLAVDLATKMGEHAAVIAHSVVAPYLEHAKGRHGREMGIMT